MSSCIETRHLPALVLVAAVLRGSKSEAVAGSAVCFTAVVSVSVEEREDGVGEKREGGRV